jgi:hypothetical protein
MHVEGYAAQYFEFAEAFVHVDDADAGDVGH